MVQVLVLWKHQNLKLTENLNQNSMKIELLSTANFNLECKRKGNELSYIRYGKNKFKK